MKLDLFTSIGVAIAGVVIAFFVTNLMIPEIEDFSYQTIDTKSTTNYADLTQPNPEVFNYDALNPTVEVYVGECEQYDDNGNCVEEVTEEDLESSDEDIDTEAGQDTEDQENG